jgi:hypothetical protein
MPSGTSSDTPEVFDRFYRSAWNIPDSPQLFLGKDDKGVYISVELPSRLPLSPLIFRPGDLVELPFDDTIVADQPFSWRSLQRDQTYFSQREIALIKGAALQLKSELKGLIKEQGENADPSVVDAKNLAGEISDGFQQKRTFPLKNSEIPGKIVVGYSPAHGNRVIINFGVRSEEVELRIGNSSGVEVIRARSRYVLASLEKAGLSSLEMKFVRDQIIANRKKIEKKLQRDVDEGRISPDLLELAVTTFDRLAVLDVRRQANRAYPVSHPAVIEDFALK